VVCAAWSLILEGKRDSKLAPRARLCCFLGYSSTQEAYKLWDPIERAVIISRDVTFDETMSASRLNRPKVSLNELKHNWFSIIKSLYPQVLRTHRLRPMYLK